MNSDISVENTKKPILKHETKNFRIITLEESNDFQTSGKSLIKDTRNNPHIYKKYDKNLHTTSKYNLISFLPKALLFQFSKFINIYLGIMVIFFLFPKISPYSPQSAVAPLIFILTIALIREGIEDYSRHKSDKKTNRSQTKIINRDVYKKIKWSKIKVGDLVFLEKNDRVPADLILLSTSNKNGISYIDTSTLDGEKHLKPREVLKETFNCINVKPTSSSKRSRKDFEIDIRVELHIEEPTISLYRFEGYLYVYKNGVSNKKKLGLSIKNLLMKDSKLMNTDWAIGIVVYTGNDTKVQKNTGSNRLKASHQEGRLMNMIIVLFCLQIVLSILTAFGGKVIATILNFEYNEFLKLNDLDGEDSESLEILFIGLRYFVLFGTFIPISLVVGLEVSRIAQSYFIKIDVEIKDHKRNM